MLFDSTWRAISLVDWMKFSSVLISLLGVLSWIAGYAFELGFWRAAGWPGPLLSPPVPVVTLNGFIYAFHSWLLAMLSLPLLAVGLLILRRVSQRKAVIEAAPVSQKARLQSLPLALLCFGLGLLLPLSLWVVGAMEQGKDYFSQLSDNLGEHQQLPSRFSLASGGEIRGRILAQTERSVILLTPCGVTMLALGAPAQILSHTRTNHGRCATALG